MKDKNIEKLIALLLASAVGGAIIGLLMKPKKELTKREKLAKKGDKYLKEGDKYLTEITDTVEEIRRFLDSKSKKGKSDLEATKADIDELSENAKGKGKDLLKRAKRLLSYDN
jgi:flagellar motility protein MotE (MotC chaperone)